MIKGIEYITADETVALEDMLKTAKLPADTLCSHFRVRRLGAIQRARFAEVLAWMSKFIEVPPITVRPEPAPPAKYNAAQRVIERIVKQKKDLLSQAQ